MNLLKKLNLKIINMVFLNIILSLFVFSCTETKNDNKNEQTNSFEAKKIAVDYNVPFTSLPTIEISDSIQKLKPEDKLLMIAIKSIEFQGNILKRDIEKITFLKKIHINGYGNSQIYEGQLRSDKLQEMVYKHFYLLINNEENKSVCFLLDNYKLIKLHDNDTSYYFAGTYLYRGRGYFIVYDYLTAQFVKIFDTGYENPEKAVFSFKYDLDCINYKDSFLLLENKRINDDELLDIDLRGIVQYYCSPNQFGYDRENAKLYKENKIEVSFLARIKDGKPSWIIKDSSYLQILHSN